MNKKFEIDGATLGKDGHVYVIAEMSANHLQDIDRAKKIIKTAKECGADAIKLQSYRPDTITIDCKKKEFMATPGSIWEGHNLYELYQTAYMPWEWHAELFAYAKECEITCFSSPFDFSAVELLEQLDAPAYKIASYEIVDIPLIRQVAKTGKPIILSTGIAKPNDIELAMETCKAEGNENVILLKCVSQYPTPYDDLNLNVMPDMAEKYDCIVGLSDHSMGSEVAVASVALGGKVIEKHLTLSREDGGADGSFSMEPHEFKQMVAQVRNVERALGICTYELTDFQKRGRNNIRSLYVVQDIKAGELFTSEIVKSVRPGYGLAPKYYDDVIGKRAVCDIERGTALSWEHIDKE